MDRFIYNYSIYKNAQHLISERAVRDFFSLIDKFDSHIAKNVHDRLMKIHKKFYFYLVINCSVDEIIQKKENIDKAIDAIKDCYNVKIIFLYNIIDLIDKYDICCLYVKLPIFDINDFNILLNIIKKKKYSFEGSFLKDNSFLKIPYWFYLLEKCFEFNVSEDNINFILDFINENLDDIDEKNKENNFYLIYHVEDNSIIELFDKLVHLSKSKTFFEKIVKKHNFLFKYIPLKIIKDMYNDAEKQSYRMKESLGRKHLNYVSNNIILNKYIIDDYVFFKKIVSNIFDNFDNNYIFCIDNLTVLPEEISKTISKKKIEKYFKVFCEYANNNNIFYKDTIDISYKGKQKYVNFLINPKVINNIGFGLVISDSANIEKYKEGLKYYNSLCSDLNLYSFLKKIHYDIYNNKSKYFEKIESEIKSIKFINKEEKQNFLDFFNNQEIIFCNAIYSGIKELYEIINQNKNLLKLLLKILAPSFF